MLHLGQKPQEVSEVLSVSLPTIYGWFHRFRAEGEAGLDHHPKSGRPPTADDSYIKVLKETLETEPQRVDSYTSDQKFQILPSYSRRSS